jgi:rubrerythrin
VSTDRLRKELEALKARKVNRCSTCDARPLRLVFGKSERKPCPECGRVPRVIRWGQESGVRDDA